jgi:hypothetical protein
MNLRKQFETEKKTAYPEMKNYDYDYESYSDDARVYLENYVEWLENRIYSIRLEAFKHATGRAVAFINMHVEAYSYQEKGLREYIMKGAANEAT